jgi:hypothetical protein
MLKCEQSDNSPITFKVTKSRDIAPINFKADLIVENDKFYLDPIELISKKEQHETAILELLEGRKKPLSKNKIYEAVGGNRNTIFALIGELVDNGKLSALKEGFITQNKVVSKKEYQYQFNGTSGIQVSPP